MGPGSQSINIYNQQHLVPNNVPSGKGNKKGNNHNHSSNTNKGAWFFEEMKKSAVFAGEAKQQRSSKGVKKTHPNLTTSHPQNAKSKPIPVNRSISHNNECGSGTKGGSTFPPKFQQPKHSQLASRNSPVKLQTPQRPSSSTPTTGTPGKFFYAGARFETHPSSVVLPSPPTHWTTPIQRSQSQPSTPTIKSVPNGNCVPIDLASLFGSPASKPVTMAKSFPGELMMKALDKKVESDSSDEELKEILSQGTKKAVVKKEDVPLVANDSPRVAAVNTNDLKKALGLITVNSPSASSTSTPKKKLEKTSLNLSCHGSLTPSNNFKEMSDQLKSLMKVAA